MIESLSASEQQINLFGDVAVVSVLIETKGQMLGQPIGGKLRYIRIWKMFDDGLEVIGGSCIQV